MDYLNYGKSNPLEQLSQEPKTEKTTENIISDQDEEFVLDDFSFGDLVNKTTPPKTYSSTRKGWKSGDDYVANIPDNIKKSQNQLLPLFPIPLVICQYPNNYDKELEWIRNHEVERQNVQELSICNRQSKESFILDKPELVNIREFIQYQVNGYVSKIMGASNELVITQSCLNKNKKGEYHHDHTHPNSIISGVWYPQIDETLPPIIFTKKNIRDVNFSIREFNSYNCSLYKLSLKMGELVLFPSNLSHNVPKNNSDKERISLSFNTWVKGNMGNIDSLTYIPIDRCV